MPRRALLAALAVTFAACGGGAPTDPPAGWEGTGSERWWRAGTDTTGLFRDLSTLDAMGVATADSVDLAPFVQERMIDLYRTDPALMDSVFARYALPVVARGVEGAADREEEADRLVTEAYRAVSDYLRQPRQDPAVQVPLVYPDSLRGRGVGGEVVIQARIDTEGQPVALKKVEGVDPTLDALAMNAATQMRWVAAGYRGEHIPSWTWMTLTYRP